VTWICFDGLRFVPNKNPQRKGKERIPIEREMICLAINVIQVSHMLQFWLQKLHKNPGSFFGEGAMDVKLFIAMLMVRLVSVTAWGHGGGGHAGHSSSGYHSSSWGGGGGGGGGGDDGCDGNKGCELGNALVGFLTVVAFILVFLILPRCIIDRLRTDYAGDPHHGFWVVPRIFWAPPYLNTPCAGPEKKT